MFISISLPRPLQNIWWPLNPVKSRILRPVLITNCVFCVCDIPSALLISHCALCGGNLVTPTCYCIFLLLLLGSMLRPRQIFSSNTFIHKSTRRRWYYLGTTGGNYTSTRFERVAVLFAFYGVARKWRVDLPYRLHAMDSRTGRDLAGRWLGVVRLGML